MPSRKRKTTAKATANATANTTAKVTAKATATAAKAKATRARNKATAARIDRILQSSPPPTAGPTGPSGPSETVGSNSVAELTIARAAGKDLFTNSNSSDSQSDSYTRLSKFELTRSLKKKAQRKLARLKAKKE
ncbi:hypothetical protein NA56DRAFT_747191 [Hyaloscypha hepaticicola]|uniref:Uncharacterized protein n=1 Tax=Hyaloscypha hepaticicola TaxID=2082293 RepID=A0A2J6QAS1_9HELO|nr:hypothetical protein NA56DRAFT_747191 [Hyaloscypha hepaticicola]